MRSSPLLLLTGALLAAGCADTARPEGPPPPVRVIGDDVVLRLETLEHDTHRHVHEENNVLFPRALALEAGR